MKRRIICLILSVCTIASCMVVSVSTKAESDFLCPQPAVRDGSTIYSVIVNEHKIINDCTLNYGYTGILYANGNVIDDNVFWKFFTNGLNIYYLKNGALYKANINTGEITKILSDDSAYLYGIYRDKYLYYTSDKYTNLSWSMQDLIIYDLENNRELTYIADVGDFVMSDNKIYTKGATGEIPKLTISEHNLDGTETKLVYEGSSYMKTIDNMLYFVSLQYLGGLYDFNSHKHQIKKYNSQTGEILALTDYKNGTPVDINKEYAIFENTNGELYTVYYKQGNDEINVVLNGEQISFDQPPIMDPAGRVLVPIRQIAEAMGDDVMWNQDLQTAFVHHKERALIIPLNMNHLYIATSDKPSQWQKYDLDVPSQEKNGRTLTPLRAFCEGLGADVDWDGNTKTVYITYNNDYEYTSLSEQQIDGINIAYGLMRNNSDLSFDKYNNEIINYFNNSDHTLNNIAMSWGDGLLDGIVQFLSGEDATEAAVKERLAYIVAMMAEMDRYNGYYEIIDNIMFNKSGLEALNSLDGLPEKKLELKVSTI